MKPPVGGFILLVGAEQLRSWGAVVVIYFSRAEQGG